MIIKWIVSDESTLIMHALQQQQQKNHETTYLSYYRESEWQAM